MGIASCRLPEAVVRRIPGRSRRVVVLLGVILVLGLADLVLTLIYVMEIGLIEDNPIARLVLETGGPGSLVVGKLASVGFTIGVLFWVRTRGIAEVAAVFGAVVMIWVTARWMGYIETSAHLTASLEEMEFHSNGAWMSLVEVETE